MNEYDGKEQTAEMEEIWNSVADGWHKWTEHLELWTKEASNKMMQEAEIENGSKVLDVATGDGSQSFIAAEIVGSDGSIIAIDFSKNLLQIAEKSAREKGYTQIETQYMNAEDLEFDDNSFDSVICKNGLMLFGNQKKAIKEYFRVLKPGGKFAAIVFSDPMKNPSMSIPGKIIMEATGVTPPKPGEPGLFTLSQPEVIKNLLEYGGFEEISISKVPEKFVLPEQIDFVNFLEEGAGVLVRMLMKLSPDEKERVIHTIRQAFSQFKVDDGYLFPSEFIVLSGRKPND